MYMLVCKLLSETYLEVIRKTINKSTCGGKNATVLYLLRYIQVDIKQSGVQHSVRSCDVCMSAMYGGECYLNKGTFATWNCESASLSNWSVYMDAVWNHLIVFRINTCRTEIQVNEASQIINYSSIHVHDSEVLTSIIRSLLYNKKMNIMLIST